MRTDIPLRFFYSGDMEEVWRVQLVSFGKREAHRRAKSSEITGIVTRYKRTVTGLRLTSCWQVEIPEGDFRCY
jgi:hypothetical protein